MSENKFELINARVTYKNLPIYQLERFSFKDIKAACESFMKIPNVSECAIIQNPFRVEVFLVIDLEKDQGLSINKIEDTWTSLTELKQHDIDHFDQTLEAYKNTDAILNLLRLAAGLDSIILGRVEILDEIKEAAANSNEVKAYGPVLKKLFDNTLRIANRIRDSTGISKGIISMGEISVKEAEEKVGLEGKHILVIGTGETAAMISKSLNKKNYPFDVTSMTIERSTAFSKVLGGKPIKFEEVISGFDKFDVIFVATTADYFIINYNRIGRLMENKKKGTLILDVSDPRAVDETVSSLPGMKLMFRDQIDEKHEEFVRASKEKVPAVEKMISKQVPIIGAFMKRK